MDRDDDLEWERWMGLTDAQQEAEIAAEMAAYETWYAALTPREQYAHRRRLIVQSCAGWRRSIKALGFGFLREHLRESQRRLAALRAEGIGKG